ncbi:hypothetical protein F4781DRAFT_441976 [Annulohypoxylon bovei var. microspora]|nr:hypothetical protein F4781DRAFT_441976 [Annulohypoxylon bovei var. microspora]
MQFKQLILASLLIFERSRACLHDHIPVPQLRDLQEALRKRDVPTPVKTAIQNVRVFDGYTIGKPQTVIIDGEYITDSDDNVVKTIDAGNSILIPGLIDAHSHVQSVEGLENMTSYGVTSIFNMALPESLRLSPGEDPKFLVDYAFGNGSDYFKINTIVEYTHSLGHFVVQHAPSVTPYTRAVSVRTDVLQHIPDDGLLPPNIFLSIKEFGLAATPTVEIFRRAYTIQPEIGQFLRGNNTANASYEHVVGNVKQLHAAGIPILGGTDSVGNTVPAIYFPFGESLHQEMANFVDFGMTPLEALRAATIVPATVHRLKDRGAIRPGLRADLILLNSDPLANITNTRDIARVWAGGVEYPNVASKSATG